MGYVYCDSVFGSFAMACFFLLQRPKKDEGCITLIPGFVAFPLAASLLAAGAGYAQIAVFISTLMMVGIATLPLEIKYFGRKTALKRNVLALISAMLTSSVIGVMMQ